MPQDNRNRRAWWYVLVAVLILIVVLIIARGCRDEMGRDGGPMIDSIGDTTLMPPAEPGYDGMSDTGDAFDRADTSTLDTGLGTPAIPPNPTPGMGGGSVPVNPGMGTP